MAAEAAAKERGGGARQEGRGGGIRGHRGRPQPQWLRRSSAGAPTAATGSAEAPRSAEFQAAAEAMASGGRGCRQRQRGGSRGGGRAPPRGRRHRGGLRDGRRGRRGGRVASREGDAGDDTGYDDGVNDGEVEAESEGETVVSPESVVERRAPVRVPDSESWRGRCASPMGERLTPSDALVVVLVDALTCPQRQRRRSG